MAFSWPNISQNQLFQAGLGLVGAGTSGGRVNPFQAASQGLMYGKQLDLSDKEQARLDAEEARRKKLEEAWAGLFGIKGAAPMPGGQEPAPVGGSGIVAGGMPPELDPMQQMASAVPGGSGLASPVMNAAGMAQQGGMPPAQQPRQAGFPNIPPQAMPLLQALGPEAGAKYLMDAMTREPKERRIVQGADGFNYYADTGERVLPGIEQKPKLTDDQREYQAAKDQGFEGSFLDYMTTLWKAGANNITNTIGGGDKFGEEFAKSTVTRLSELEGKAQDAVSTLQANQEAMGILDQGIISGAGADWRLGAAKLAAQAGFDVDTDPIAATEAYFSNRAKAVATMAKNFGSGAGITEADREFAERAAGGDVEMTEKSLRRILEIGNKAAAAQIKAYNDYAARVRKMRPEEGQFILDVEAPEFPAPKQYNVPPPAERTIGSFYDTPKGRAMWTGEDWILEKDVPGGPR